MVAKRYFLSHHELVMDATIDRSREAAALRRAIDLIGGAEQVASLRGLKTAWSVRKWLRDGLPLEHTLPLAELTGWRVTPNQLAPTAYPNPEDGLPELFRKAARRAAEAAAAGGSA